jgi:hypothetical protein
MQILYTAKWRKEVAVAYLEVKFRPNRQTNTKNVSVIDNAAEIRNEFPGNASPELPLHSLPL